MRKRGDEYKGLDLNNANVCPSCGNLGTGTIDSRTYDLKLRRRYCYACGYRFGTVEILESDAEEIARKLGNYEDVFEKMRGVLNGKV